LINDDTAKQLLARSRYFLYKNQSKCSINQTQRDIILFKLYPDIQKAYNLAQDLRNICEKTTDKIIGLERLARWHEKRSSLNVVGKYISNDFCNYKIYLNARFL
jgi:transposase